MGYGLLFITVLALAMQICLAEDVDCKKRPPRVDPRTCCPMPDLITEEVKEKCKEFMMPPPPMSGKEFMPPPPPPMSGETAVSVDSKRPHPPPPGHHRGPPMHSCFMSCVFNETGIVMDGKLNDAKLSAYLKVVLKDSTSLIPVVETSFKTCSVKAEEFHAKMQEKIKNRSTPSPSTNNNNSQDRMMRPRCPPFAGHLMACVHKESLMNCPASVWSNTKECNDMREHMKHCMPKFKHSMESSDSKSVEEKM